MGQRQKSQGKTQNILRLMKVKTKAKAELRKKYFIVSAYIKKNIKSITLTSPQDTRKKDNK